MAVARRTRTRPRSSRRQTMVDVPRVADALPDHRRHGPHARPCRCDTARDPFRDDRRPEAVAERRPHDRSPRCIAALPVAASRRCRRRVGRGAAVAATVTARRRSRDSRSCSTPRWCCWPTMRWRRRRSPRASPPARGPIRTSSCSPAWRRSAGRSTARPSTRGAPAVARGARRRRQPGRSDRQPAAQQRAHPRLRSPRVPGQRPARRRHARACSRRSAREPVEEELAADHARPRLPFPNVDFAHRRASPSATT